MFFHQHDLINTFFTYKLKYNLGAHFAETHQVTIANFSVNFYSLGARNICFENDIYIALKEDTIVTPLPEMINIPEHVFNFTEFRDLPVMAHQNRYLTGIEIFQHILF